MYIISRLMKPTLFFERCYIANHSIAWLCAVYVSVMTYLRHTPTKQVQVLCLRPSDPDDDILRSTATK